MMEIHVYESLDSTNSFLLERDDLRAGQFTAVRAITQTAGRGRHGRSWFSGSARDLAFSFAFLPKGEMSPGALTAFAGFALYRVLSPLCGERLSIKWPNDLYYEKKKLSGILTEYKEGSYVVGIGLNVNSRGEDLSPKAVSLAEICGTEHDVDALMRSILDEEMLLLEGLTLPVDIRFISAFTAVCRLTGRRVRYTSAEGIADGIITGLSPRFELEIAKDDGVIIYAGESEFIDE